MSVSRDGRPCVEFDCRRDVQQFVENLNNASTIAVFSHTNYKYRSVNLPTYVNLNIFDVDELCHEYLNQHNYV